MTWGSFTRNSNAPRTQGAWCVTTQKRTISFIICAVLLLLHPGWTPWQTTVVSICCTTSRRRYVAPYALCVDGAKSNEHTQDTDAIRIGADNIWCELPCFWNGLKHAVINTTRFVSTSMFDTFQYILLPSNKEVLTREFPWTSRCAIHKIAGLGKSWGTRWHISLCWMKGGGVVKSSLLGRKLRRGGALKTFLR